MLLNLSRNCLGRNGLHIHLPVIAMNIYQLWINFKWAGTARTLKFARGYLAASAGKDDVTAITAMNWQIIKKAV